MKFKVVPLLLIGISVAACAHSNQRIDRNQLGSYFDVRFGYVDSVRDVKIKSNAPQAAVMGGVIGGATSGHKHRAKHALEGAVAAALITSLLESNKKHAYEYTVGFVEGGEVKLVTEQGGIRRGDCVAVERGQTANIRRVSYQQCESHNHEAYDHPVVHAKRQSEAAECHHAKEIALNARSEEQMNLALKKVHIFCDN